MYYYNNMCVYNTTNDGYLRLYVNSENVELAI